MPRRPRSSVIRGLRITFVGILFFAVTTLVGLAGLNGDANLLLLLFGTSMGLFFFNAIAAMRMARSVNVDRIIPQTVVAHRPYTVVYVVQNRRRWFSAWSLVVGEIPIEKNIPFPMAFVPLLHAKQEQRIELQAVCPRRGPLELKGIRISSRFPLGLFSYTMDLSTPAELVVYPAVIHIRRELWRHQEAAGLLASRRRREHVEQDEFYGVREYRQGDNPKWVHWRRSARTGQLIVREHAPLRATQVIMIVDPWSDHPTKKKRHMPPFDATAERLISAAATATCDALERGHRVGLIGRAALPVVIAPAGGRPQRQRLLHELAILRPRAQEPLTQLITRVRWTHGWNARCIIFAAEQSTTIDHVVRYLHKRAEAVTLISPPSGTLDKFFDMRPEPHGKRRVG